MIFRSNSCGPQAVNSETNVNTPLIPAKIYQIDPATGETTPGMLTNPGLSSFVNVNDRIYGFDAFTDQVVTLNLTTGQTTPVSAVHGAACEAGPPSCVIVGATAAHPVGEGRR
jgi:hypothetical protein